MKYVISVISSVDLKPTDRYAFRTWLIFALRHRKRVCACGAGHTAVSAGARIPSARSTVPVNQVQTMDDEISDCEVCGSVEGCERRADACVVCTACARARDAEDEPEADDNENEEPRQQKAATPNAQGDRRKQRPQAACVLDCSRRLQPAPSLTFLHIKPMAAAELANLEHDTDRNLMKLLWAHGWTQPDDNGFMLLPHQFAAVRFVAGVATSWPKVYPPVSFPRRAWSARTASAAAAGFSVMQWAWARRSSASAARGCVRSCMRIVPTRASAPPCAPR